MFLGQTYSRLKTTSNLSDQATSTDQFYGSFKARNRSRVLKATSFMCTPSPVPPVMGGRSVWRWTRLALLTLGTVQYRTPGVTAVLECLVHFSWQEMMEGCALALAPHLPRPLQHAALNLHQSWKYD